MKTKLILCAALLTVTLLPCAGLADGKNGRREHPGKKMFAELGVTPEQEVKLKEIHAASAPAKKLSHQQIEVVRQKIKVELQKEKPSKSVLNKYAAEIGNLHKQMNLAAIDRLLKVKEVLTPEQFSKMSERGFIGGPGGPDKMRMTHKPPHEGKDGEKFRKPKGDGYGPEGAEFRRHRYRDKEHGKNLGGGFVPENPESQPAAELENNAGGEPADTDNP